MQASSRQDAPSTERLTVGQPGALPSTHVRVLGRYWRLSLRAQGKSKMTLATYLSALDRLADFLEANGMPTDAANVKREHVEAFIAHLLETRKPATASNRYRALQAYWRFLVEEGELTESPMRNMRPPRVPVDPPPVLSMDDVHRVFKACKGKRFEDRRDEVLLRLLFDTGCRRSELAGIQVEDVDLETGEKPVIWVLGKGSRRRQVPFTPETAKALWGYMLVRERHPHAGHPALFVGAHGPMTGNGIAQIVRKRARKAGLAAHVYPHLFRHTFAHRYLLLGGQETALMRLTGWRSRDMVARYGASAADQRALEEYRRLWER
jgi:site-specific recombinase XerD